MAERHARGGGRVPELDLAQHPECVFARALAHAGLEFGGWAGWSVGRFGLGACLCGGDFPLVRFVMLAPSDGENMRTYIPELPD